MLKLKNKCCYNLSKCTKWHIFHSKWSKLSVAQLVTTFIFFSAWDKSHVKWDNPRKPTQKMRTLVSTYVLQLVASLIYFILVARPKLHRALKVWARNVTNFKFHNWIDANIHEGLIWGDHKFFYDVHKTTGKRKLSKKSDICHKK